MKHFYWLMLLAHVAAGQTQMEVFIRTPHIVNYQFAAKELSYAPAISGGITVRRKTMFADLGSFVTSSSAKGHYLYFGSALLSRSGNETWMFVLNWFGEPTWLASVTRETSPWVGTIGISPVLVKPIPWGVFAVAITSGIAMHQRDLSLNHRLILNYSLPLKRVH